MSTKHGLAHRFYTGQISYDFVGHKKFWYAFSAVVLAVCFMAVGFKGLVLGIDFRGGTDFQVAMPVTETTVDEVRAKVADFEVRTWGPRSSPSGRAPCGSRRAPSTPRKPSPFAPPSPNWQT